MIQTKTNAIAPEIRTYSNVGNSVIDTIGPVIKNTINVSNGIMIDVASKGLYSDPILAVIREYCTNAQDAHTESGYPTRPIKVTLPTYEDCVFRVRDYGKDGLDYKTMQNIFAVYGESTKRNDDTQTGKWGLGCKSWRSYGDSYQVVTYINGTKTIYDGYFTVEDYNGQLVPMGAYPTDEENGTEIIIPVKRSDIYNFQSKCEKFFAYFEPKPEFNLALNIATPVASIKGVTKVNKIRWQITGSENSYRTFNSVVIMSNVAYPLDSSQFQRINNDTIAFILRKGVNIWMPPNSVEILPSREGLRYDRFTISNLEEVLLEIETEFKHSIISSVDSADDAWNACKKVKELNERYGHDAIVNGNLKDYHWYGIRLHNKLTTLKFKLIQEKYKEIYYNEANPLGFFIDKQRPKNNGVQVFSVENTRKRGVGTVQSLYTGSYFTNEVELIYDENSCFVVQDEELYKEKLLHFLTTNGFKKVYVFTTGNYKECLEALCLTKEFYKLSEMPEAPKKERKKRDTSGVNKSEKHQAKVFSYNGSKHFGDKKDIWDVDILEGEEIVYVVLDRFKIHTDKHVYEPEDFIKLINDLESFGIEVPVIYGIKPNKLEELKAADVVDETWTNFYDLVPDMLKELLPNKWGAYIFHANSYVNTSSSFTEYYTVALHNGYYDNIGGVAKELLDEIKAVSEYTRPYENDGIKYDTVKAFQNQCYQFKVDYSSYKEKLPEITKTDEFYKKYPLLRDVRYNAAVSDYHFQYITLINKIEVDLEKKMG